MAAQSLLQQVGVYAQGVVKGLATISVLQLLLILIGSAVSFVLLKGFYNIFLHPLRHYPGPRLAAFSHIWMINELRRGRFLYTLRPLHAKYGPVVRVAPNELMYIGPEPLKNIFDIKVNPEYQKDMSFLDDGFSGRSIVSALKESHRDQRRSLAPGFSEKSLRLQEPIIKDYVGQLFRLFHKKVGTSFDVVKVFNYFTFDVIGDLSYGEPFGCLANDNYHPWIQNIFGNIEGAPFNRFLGINPWLRPLVHKLMPQHIRKAVEDHVALTVEKMDRRLVSDKDRPDFLQNLVKTGNLPPRQDLYATGGALILAGSETTATALSGTTWFLWKNPEVRAKLQAELDEAFSSPEDITLVGVGQCRYLCACIDESLRLYPPQGLSNGRIVPDGGSLIDGKFVPGGISVGISYYTAHRNPEWFTKADEYCPERWLGDPLFANDNKFCYTPFSIGPRNCIGKNLAFSELRTVIARLFLEFDVHVLPESEKWLPHGHAGAWLKPPLMVTMTPRKRD